MDLILQVRQLIAAAKAGDWKTVVTLVGVLLTQAADLLPGPVKVKTATVPGAKTVDELCGELEGFCAAHTTACAATAAPTALGGGFLALILPIILEILRKRFLASLLLIFVLAFGTASAADLGSPIPPLRAAPCACSLGGPCVCGPGCQCAAPVAKARVAETVAPPVLVQYRVVAGQPMVCGPNGCQPATAGTVCGPNGCQPAQLPGRFFRRN